ncbi:MAG TPA: hypothetical protein VEK07_01005 [Polyangiaceae bacterium]|nr:hypothetical protein [Polyangiaceae bacterium]
MRAAAPRMPIVFAPVVGVLLGSALAWAAWADLAASDRPVAFSRSFAVIVAFAAFVWLPVVGYFAAFHGDWSYLYLVASRRVPSAIDLVLVLAAGGDVLAGFWVAAHLMRKRRSGLLYALIAAPAIVLAAALSLTVRRLAVSATFAQFHGDFGTEPIGASVLGKGVLLMGFMLALGVGWTVHALARLGSEAPGNAGRPRRG